jgi:hypothetical protein
LESVAFRASDTPKRKWLSTVVDGGQLYFSLDADRFHDFMDSFNYVLASVKRGKVERKDRGFPRELLWYFRVDNLVLGA